MTDTPPPLPDLIATLRMCADWHDPDCTTSRWQELHGRNAWDRMGTGTAEHEFAVALRAAADRLAAEPQQPAADLAELQRLRDENAKLLSMVTNPMAIATPGQETLDSVRQETEVWKDRAEWLLREMRGEADRG